MTDSSLQNGYLWFFSLLIINLLLVSITVGYYYYLNNQTGTDGLPGDAGFTGQEGDQCMFTTPNGGCAS